MIPVYTEISELKNEISERCVFCNKSTRTWHENTNNPVCIDCAKIYKVSDIKEDHGRIIRRLKRQGKFDRKDSVRAN